MVEDLATRRKLRSVLVGKRAKMTEDPDSFPPEVADALQFYVYRLIDPRNAETFYVGKGKGSRVFQHVAGYMPDDPDEDEASTKMHRIRSIINEGFKVEHLIHRHGMDSKTAFEVEAAVMDAYPGMTNVASGHGSRERGIAHARSIIEIYRAEEAVIDDPVIEITVRWSATHRELYDATRFAWKVSLRSAEKAKYAFAVLNGMILEVYEVERWLPANDDNFPNIAEPGMDLPKYGFEGKVAPKSIRDKYVRKKVPKKKRGAANPFRYHNLQMPG